MPGFFRGSSPVTIMEVVGDICHFLLRFLIAWCATDPRHRKTVGDLNKEAGSDGRMEIDRCFNFFIGRRATFCVWLQVLYFLAGPMENQLHQELALAAVWHAQMVARGRRLFSNSQQKVTLLFSKYSGGTLIARYLGSIKLNARIAFPLTSIAMDGARADGKHMVIGVAVQGGNAMWLFPKVARINH